MFDENGDIYWIAGLNNENIIPYYYLYFYFPPTILSTFSLYPAIKVF